jgi:hypothetical protein
MLDGLTNLTIPANASSSMTDSASRRDRRKRGHIASLAAARPDDPDATVIGLARELLSNQRRLLRAQAELPDPDAWSPLSSRCDRETLAMDHADNEDRRLRSDLAARRATTLEGLQAKAIAFLSDCGVHPAQMTERDWADLDLEPWVESMLRDIVAMWVSQA